MSNLDAAAKEVSLLAHLVGLWLAMQHIRSISPNFGVQLLEMADACHKQLASETDSVVVEAVSQFIQALRLVSDAALVHNATILDQLVKAVGPVEKEEEPLV